MNADNLEQAEVELRDAGADVLEVCDHWAELRQERAATIARWTQAVKEARHFRELKRRGCDALGQT